MVQLGGSTHDFLWPPSRQCFFWHSRSQYKACLHRAHLLRSAGSPESSLPHCAHAQTHTAVGGAAVTPGSAAALLLLEAAAATDVALLPPGGRTRGSALSSTTWAVAPPPVAAAHAEHLRVLAGFFFWLLLNWPGALLVLHSEHRMADGFDEATVFRNNGTVALAKGGAA